MKRALILIAACRHAAPAPAPANHVPATVPVSTTGVVMHGQVSNSCGPTDGPATAIVLTPDDLACKPSGYTGFLRIEVWGGSRNGTVDLTSGGDGMRCPDAQSCENATKGTLDWGDATHAPSYSLTFADGTTLTGTFTIDSCNFPMECG